MYRISAGYDSTANHGHVSSDSDDKDSRDEVRITTDIMSHDSAEDSGYHSKGGAGGHSGEYDILKVIEESEEISFTHSTLRHPSDCSEDAVIIPTKIGQAPEEVDTISLIQT